MFNRTKHNNKDQRRGVVTVEMALTITTFAIFLGGILEFGHVYMVIGTLNGAAKRAARYGAAEGITTAEVEARVDEILSKGFDHTQATVYVRDASVFDDGATDPSTISYSGLPAIELADAEVRDLYVVRVEVPYEDVALIPPFWAKNVTLTGQSVMRHE